MFITIGTALAGIFGKSITQKTAKIIGIVAGAALLLAVLSLGKCAYDKSIVNDYKQERQAKIDRGLLKAEREATAADIARDKEFAESAAVVKGDTQNAKDKDPNGGRTNAGPVTQSYFDSVRRERDRKARGE